MTDRELLQMALDALEHGLPIIEDFGGKEQLQIQHKAISVLYEALRARLAQPEPEPVAVFCREILGRGQIFWLRSSDELPNETPLYTVPPQRKWVGLTEEVYEAMAEQYVTNCYFDTLKYAKAIEAKLKEKNT